MKPTLPRVLCVDDEVYVLRALRRSLRNHFDVVTAEGGEQALQILAADDSFQVMVSDMRMPGMSGVDVLREARLRRPDMVRILLTGYADLESAIGAVNEGHVFRFLSKPCPTPDLVRALHAAVKQHQLVMAERVLLKQTLVGAIETLSQVLALANPAAFGRASRARRGVKELARHLDEEVGWEVEAAALLSQIGCVTLPPETADRLYRGEALNADERAMVKRIPTVGSGLVAHIPRLEEVQAILRFQAKQFDGGGLPVDEVRGEDIPLGARMLKIVLDYDALTARELDDAEAVDTLRGRRGHYDPGLLEAFAQLRGCATQLETIKEVGLRDLKTGMVFAADLTAGKNNVILVARGQEVTLELKERIWNFSRRMPVNEPISVWVRRASGAMQRARAPRRATGAVPRRTTSAVPRRTRAVPRRDQRTKASRRRSSA